MLYQLDLRLKEVKNNQSDFGGVAVLLCGDLMQLRPVKANWIFEEPKNEDFQVSHLIRPLWQQFQSFELTHNHRQGSDKEYGDILNRLRVGLHTQADMEKLRTRLTDDYPEDSLFIYGKRDPMMKKNHEKLSLLPGEVEVLQARHIHPLMKKYYPKIDDYGFVHETPFMDKLMLKIGARVMITYNVDTTDGLTNGTTGEVVGFVRERGRVIQVLLKLDDPDAGKNLRQKHKAKLKKLNMQFATPIGRCSFEYSLGKSHKHHGSKAKVIQFPLTLAYALTAHKCQGMTIKSPDTIVVDLETVFAAGMAYVMLGRIQNICQLYFKTFNPSKFMVSPSALEEAQSIKKEALNNPANCSLWMSTNTFIRRITSLNIRSLPFHREDLLCDPAIQKSDVICLQETFCSRSNEVPNLPGYSCHLAGEGRGRGVAVFIRNWLVEKKIYQAVERLDHDNFQGLKIIFKDLHLITIYR